MAYYRSSHTIPSSDRRGGYGPDPDDGNSNPSNYRRDYYSQNEGSTSRRRFSPPPHDHHRRNRSPPRGPAAMEQRHQPYDYDRRSGGSDSRYDPSWRPNESNYNYNGSSSGGGSGGRYYRHSSPPRSRYRDRDMEGYRSPQYDDHGSRSRTRSRSRSPRQNWFGRNPSREVIMEGLPADAMEQDIKANLEETYHVQGLVDVRIIRDKKTGVSRQFGFLQFSSIDDSTLFLEKNHPRVWLQREDGEPFSVTLAFSRERDERDRGNGGSESEWTCSSCSASNYPRRMECFRCQAPKSQFALPAVRNFGDSDVSPSSTPSQFLLFRGLESSVSEEILAKGVAKLCKSSEPSNSGSLKKSDQGIMSTTANPSPGAEEGSIKRVFLVRSRSTDDSWRYGFAEFHTVDDARAAFAKYNSLDKFTISSKAIMVDYIHAGVFIPATNRREDDKFSFAITTAQSTRLSYWDTKGYLSELVVSEPPAGKAAPAASTPLKKAKGEGHPVSKEGEGKSKKRKAEPANAGTKKKAMPSHLQYWADRHAEIHGSASKPSVEADTLSDLASATTTKPAESESQVELTRSYADMNRKCCYLCSRQFKTISEVNKHERLSQMHRDNLKNDDLKAKAVAKLEKAGIKPNAGAKADTKATEQPEYRDRAKERRQVYGQPKKPSVRSSTPLSGNNKRRSSEEEEAGSSSCNSNGAGPRARPPTKGASLLGKMGWSEGQGLGASGTGMTAPITTEAYVAGVGLGAKGGKLGDAAEEAERNTRGGFDMFVERARDVARERWESLAGEQEEQK